MPPPRTCSRSSRCGGKASRRCPTRESGARAEGAPVSLTAGDGTGLEIAALSASAVVQDPLAFTELRFVFKNPAPRAIEGRFDHAAARPAPPSAASPCARATGREGEVVELQAARAAYEDFLHRRSNPALLEKQAGNRFQARVFPIPASGEKKAIIFSYSPGIAGARSLPALPPRLAAPGQAQSARPLRQARRRGGGAAVVQRNPPDRLQARPRLRAAAASAPAQGLRPAGRPAGRPASARARARARAGRVVDALRKTGEHGHRRADNPPCRIFDQPEEAKTGRADLWMGQNDCPLAQGSSSWKTKSCLALYVHFGGLQHYAH